MQHISDDMDELLRSAAENYPLKISGADWEGIAGRLSGTAEETTDEVVPVVAMPFYKVKIYRYAMLLLLVPLAYFAARYAGLTGSTGKPNGIENSVVVTKPPALKNEGIKGVPRKDKSDDNGEQAAENNNGAAVNEKNSTPNIVADSRKNRGLFSSKSRGGSIVNGIDTAGNKSVLQESDVYGVARNAKKHPIGNANDTAVVASSSNKRLPSNPTKINNADTADNDSLEGRMPPHEKGKKANAPEAAKKKVNAIIYPAKVKRFYIGAYLAPEYTTVKYQPSSKMGFTFGGMLGYKLSSYLSIEAGIAAGKKYYTSNGKYFNSNVSWLRNWDKVVSLSGYASLTEFPINVKYAFKTSKGGNFFVTAGLISYIVHRENYTYLVDKNNNLYTIAKTPIMPSQNFLSNMSVSGGYESKFGRLCDFRIEPYYRVPIKGIGIGDLPITSVGLNIGVTKKIK